MKKIIEIKIDVLPFQGNDQIKAIKKTITFENDIQYQDFLTDLNTVIENCIDYYGNE